MEKKNSVDTDIIWNSSNKCWVLALVEAGLAPHMTAQTDSVGKRLLWCAAGSGLDVPFQFPAPTTAVEPRPTGACPTLTLASRRGNGAVINI